MVFGGLCTLGWHCCAFHNSIIEALLWTAKGTWGPCNVSDSWALLDGPANSQGHCDSGLLLYRPGITSPATTSSHCAACNVIPDVVLNKWMPIAVNYGPVSVLPCRQSVHILTMFSYKRSSPVLHGSALHKWPDLLLPAGMAVWVKADQLWPTADKAQILLSSTNIEPVTASRAIRKILFGIHICHHRFTLMLNIEKSPW